MRTNRNLARVHGNALKFLDSKGSACRVGKDNVRGTCRTLAACLVEYLHVLDLADCLSKVVL